MSGEQIWIWGRHPVLEALRAQRAVSISVAHGRHPAPVLREIMDEAARQRIPVQEVPPNTLHAIAPDATMQGIAALVRIRRLQSISEMLSLTSGAGQDALVLVLDQIQDPHNLGALLRSAEAAGVQGVVVPSRRSAPLSGTVAKASAGALSHLPILEVTNLARAMEDLRQAGLWLVGLEGSARTSLFASDLRIPLALVVGGEGGGLRRLTQESCDLLVHLPMHGVVESLNASVAGSIALFEVVRQRGA